MARKQDVDVLQREEVVWRAWPVSWSGIWVGALTALAILIIFGLIAIAVGAHLVGPSSRILSWREYGLLALAFSVGGAFFSFVAGGWAAARIAGILRAEAAMLHGAISWLLAVPLLIALATLGGGAVLGNWYGSLAGTPAWAQQPPTTRVVTTESGTAKVAPVPTQDEVEAARAARNSALGALTALILGLVGSVLGGWLACGEPMNIAYYRIKTTDARLADNARLGNSELVSPRT